MQSNLENIIQLFQKMDIDGFYTNEPLQWGFYFVDEDKHKLQAVFEELKDSGYTVEDIYKVDEADPQWTLHVSKIDILTPEKLHRRNLAFNELADYCGVALYDGWDAGKINS